MTRRGAVSKGLNDIRRGEQGIHKHCRAFRLLYSVGDILKHYFNLLACSKLHLPCGCIGYCLHIIIQADLVR
jgi:hypothetical protein